MQSLLLCLLLAAAIGAARAEVCPDGLEGPDCGMCIGGSAIGGEACVNMTDYASAFCYSNHTWADSSTSKTYDCSTEGTDYAGTVDGVWAQCYADVKKCDVHFALAGSPLTCSGLNCAFDDGAVFCSYTKCKCDAACPTMNGVSLGYLLERMTGKTAIRCEASWPEALCSFEIEGLSAASEGFQANCKAAECRNW
ncbi:hypothetical protein ACK3TF_005042 [Chlorella vulgaris]